MSDMFALAAVGLGGLALYYYVQNKPGPNTQVIPQNVKPPPPVRWPVGGYEPGGYFPGWAPKIYHDPYHI